MGDTSISWTDKTWNCVRGCSRVSEGCRNCYAERQALRFAGPRQPYEGLVTKRLKVLNADEHDKGNYVEAHWTGKVMFLPGMLSDPLRWKKPCRVFVNSMADLFHEELGNEQIAAVFGVMAAAKQHTFQILTKRARRMREWFRWLEGEAASCNGMVGMSRAARCFVAAQREDPYFNLDGTPTIMRRADVVDAGLNARWPLPNVWIGVSVENQDAADERLPELLSTPAAIRFLSCEPLLGQIDLSRWLSDDDQNPVSRGAGLSGGHVRRVGDRREGEGMEARSASMGPMDEIDQNDTVQTTPRGARQHERIPTGPSNDRQQTMACAGSSTCLETLQGADSGRNDHQPQERAQERQPAREPGTSLRLGANDSREQNPRNRSGREPAWRTQPPSQANDRSSDRDPQGEESRREVAHVGGALPSELPAHLRCGSRPRSIGWIIVGCESGPRSRSCDYRWLRSLRDQCEIAGVAFFLKQAERSYAETGTPNWPLVVTGGEGSKQKSGGIFERPYLDGVQHLAFPR